MSQAGEAVLTRIDAGAGTATITLNRPPLNILDIATLEALSRALDQVAREPGCAFVVLRGAGEKAFCAGADVGDHLPEKAPKMLEAFHRVARQLHRMDAVSIAVVQRVALGAGFELAVCCDLIVASEKASFGQPEISLACFPPIAAAVLPERIGRHRAADIVLTGRRVTAQEAAGMGLVARVAPADGLEAATESLLGELGSSSRSAMMIAKRALRRSAPSDFDAFLERAENTYVEELLKLEDAREGIRAFMEKRSPKWEHR